MNGTVQSSDLFGQAEINEDMTKRALDELFTLTRQYKSAKAYHDLLTFIGHFRFYSPFNAMLVHVQMPGARFVAPPSRWLHEYGRRIKPGARPLVILQPMGPVMFVFDVSDTEPQKGAPQLPEEVLNPFEPRRGKVGKELEQTIENAMRDGVRIASRKAGSQSAGVIQIANGPHYQRFEAQLKPKIKYVNVKVRFEMLVNRDSSREARYATIAHELAHLYCGHLGTPDPHWWPDRRGLAHIIEESEAESVCYLVCARLGIDNPSEQYLAHLANDNGIVPPISLECVMAASGLIERMGRARLKPRKPHTESKKPAGSRKEAGAQEVQSGATSEAEQPTQAEGLETSPNIRLDPGANAALGGLPPLLVWSQVVNLVAHTFEAYPDEADKLLDKYQPPVNQEWLYLALQHLDPVVGINNLVEINDHPKLNLKDLMKSNPPDVLEKVLFMVTLSSKLQSEVAT